MSDRNKRLTEAMGECWHAAGKMRRISDQHIQKDCKCGRSSNWVPLREENKEFRFINNNFSTWEGFGKLWEWASRQDWWNDFFCSSCHEATEWFQMLINPDIFANSVHEYLKDQQP